MPEDAAEMVTPQERRRDMFRLSMEKKRESQRDRAETGERFTVDSRDIQQADILIGNESERLFARSEKLQKQIDEEADPGEKARLEEELSAVQEHGTVYANATGFKKDLHGTKLRFYVLEDLKDGLLTRMPGEVQGEVDEWRNAETPADRFDASENLRRAIEDLPPEQRKVAQSLAREWEDVDILSGKLDRAMSGRVGLRERFVDWVGGKSDETSVRRWLAREMVAPMLGVDYWEMREGRRLSQAQRQMLEGEMGAMEFAESMEREELDKLADEVDARIKEKKEGEVVPEPEMTEAEKKAAEAAEKYQDEENRGEKFKMVDKYKKRLADIISSGATDEEKLEQLTAAFGEIAAEITADPEARAVLGRAIGEKVTKDENLMKSKDASIWRAMLLMIILNLADEITSAPGKFVQEAIE